jgi:hypothetical protein
LCLSSEFDATKTVTNTAAAHILSVSKRGHRLQDGAHSLAEEQSVWQQNPALKSGAPAAINSKGADMVRVTAVNKGAVCVPGVAAASFGAGLLAAICLPNPVLVVIAAALLILCGIWFCR